jgi:hypothetical protein
MEKREEFNQISEAVAAVNDEALLADGFEDALLGYATIFNRSVALYDREKCLEILMKRYSMSRKNAEEYFEFNVIGAYMGENTPAFATILKK